MTHIFLDARTATPHFPGIGRYVRNLAAAMAPLLADDERLTLLWDPSTPGAWDPTPLADGRVGVVSAPVSPFGLAQQVRIPKLLNAQCTMHNAQWGGSHAISQSPNLPISQSKIYHSPYYLMPYTVPMLARMPGVLTFYDLIPVRFPDLVSAQARLLFRFAMRLGVAQRRGTSSPFPSPPARI